MLHWVCCETVQGDWMDKAKNINRFNIWKELAEYNYFIYYALFSLRADFFPEIKNNHWIYD